MVGRWIVSLSVAALLAGVGVAQAAPKAKPKPAATKPAAKPAPKPAPAKSKKGKEADKEKEQERDKEQDKPDEQPTTAEDAKAATKEDSVKTAGTATPKSQAAEVKVKEDKEGVKTYKFETVEVEGRLKSPQVIYFLRRVRAEFEAGALGHRSFLGELSDSRRSAALR